MKKNEPNIWIDHEGAEIDNLAVQVITNPKDEALLAKLLNMMLERSDRRVNDMIDEFEEHDKYKRWL